MMSPLRTLLVLLLAGLGLQALAQDNPPYDFSYFEDGRPELKRILDGYRDYCAAEAGGTDLLVQSEEQAFVETDIDGDGARDDLVLDMGKIYCNRGYTLWAGTGGSPIHFIIDGTISQSWSGLAWEIERLGPWYSAVILIARHGSACDGAGVQPCVQAVVYDENAEQFMTVRFPQAIEEPEADN